MPLFDSFPLKLSLCIFSSVAIAAYLVKKSIESKDENGDDALRSKQSFIEIKVPEECVGSIIGPQGSVIKEIQRKTNTRIGFRDRLPPSSSPNAAEASKNGKRENSSSEHGKSAAKADRDRVLVIRGSQVNVFRAEIEIRGMILDSPHKLTEYFYVPDEACGRIIGRRGATIKEISSLSNCVIKLSDEPVDANDARVQKNTLISEMLPSSSSSSGGDNIVTEDSSEDWQDYESEMVGKLKLKKIAITGSPEQIEQAKELINNKIREESQFKERAFSRRNKDY